MIARLVSAGWGRGGGGNEVGGGGGGVWGAGQKYASLLVYWCLRGFLYNVFRDNRSSSRHLGSMNTSVYYVRACDPGVRDIDQVK